MDRSTAQIKRRFRNYLILVQLLLLIVFVGVTFGGNYYFKKQTANQIGGIVSGLLKKGDHREVIYTLGSANMENFSSIAYFDKRGRRVFSLPASLNNFEFNKNKFLYNSVEHQVFFEESSNSEIVGRLKFSFSSKGAIAFGFALWFLALFMTLPLTRRYFNMAISNAIGEVEQKRAKDLVEMASIIKHDLRGPMQSILMAVQTSKEMEQNSKEMILSGVSRIEKITRDLGQVNNIKSKDAEVPTQEDNQIGSLFLAVQSIVQEKTHTYRKVKGLNINAKFEDDSISKFVAIKESDLKRILSNLIDNSVEAFTEDQVSKNVELILKEDYLGINISIKDNGPGIPRNVMKNIGEKGNTYGKENGSGLGIYSSKKKLSEVDATFDVQTSDKGTSVIIGLKTAITPSWSIRSFKDLNTSSYVLLDDDESISERLRTDMGVLRGNTKHIDSFNTIHSFHSWESQNGQTDQVYLIDYDLKDPEKDGLDIIKELDKPNSYLFTNNFDDYFLQRACEKNGVQMIPKTILGWG